MCREFLDEPVGLHASTGSFDCVVLRFADDNFAQDAKFVGVKGKLRAKS